MKMPWLRAGSDTGSMGSRMSKESRGRGRQRQGSARAGRLRHLVQGETYAAAAVVVVVVLKMKVWRQPRLH